VLRLLLFAAEEVKSLWLEYENNASLEANLVKDFDKVNCDPAI
jgi:5'-deoxynucleotidase YfbR-like HD superfamily hydrolase